LLIHIAGVACRPRARGRALGWVVDVLVGAAVGVSDWGCAAAGGAVLVAARRLDTQQQHDDMVLGNK
jgi:hypothetical protein